MFLGGWKAAFEESNLEELGITHILSLGIEPTFLPVSKFKRLFIEVRDVDTEDLMSHFPNAVAFIDEGLSSGGRVLVHCIAGVSRSASCVIAYLMQKRQMRMEEALTFV